MKKKQTAAERMKHQAMMNEGLAIIITAQVQWKQGKITIEEAMDAITGVVETIGKELLGDVTWIQLVENKA